MTSRPPARQVRRATAQQIESAARYLRSLQFQVQRLETPELGLDEATGKIAKAMGFSDYHVGRLLERAGIAPPLRRTLTAGAIDRFITEARQAQATYPNTHTRTKGAKSAALKVTAPKGASSTSTVTVWRASPEQLRSTGRTLTSYQRWSRDRSQKPPTLTELTRELALDLSFREAHVKQLLREARIADPLSATMGHSNIGRFLRAAEISTVTYPGPYPQRSALEQAAAPAGTKREQKMTRVRAAFRAHRAVLDDPGLTDSPLEELVTAVATASGIPADRIADAMRVAGVVEPQQLTVTAEAVEIVIAEAFNAAPADPEEWPTRTPSTGETPGCKPVHARFAGPDRLAAARLVLRSAREELDTAGGSSLSVAELARRVANTLTFTLEHAAALLNEAGIREPLHRTLEQRRINRFLKAAYTSAARYPVPNPIPELIPTPAVFPSRGDAVPVNESQRAFAMDLSSRVPEESAHWQASAGSVHHITSNNVAQPTGSDVEVDEDGLHYPTDAQLDAAGQLLRSPMTSSEGVDRKIQALVWRLAVTLQFPERDVHALLRECGIAEPLTQTVTPARIYRFLATSAAYGVSSEQVPERVINAGRSSDAVLASEENRPLEPITSPAQTHKTMAAEARANTLAEGTEQHPQAELQQAQQAATVPVDLGSTAGSRSPARRRPQPYPACQRLSEGWATATPAHRMADLYLALIELTTYRSTPQEQALAEIAAGRFGIHSDATTAARLNDRAAQLWRAGEGGVQLDHLSRLERRIRGVFHDGHRDRVTAWDSSTGTMLLYTCTGAELRAAAQAAHDYGDLTIPAMRRQTVGPTYQPTGAEDPALLLAVAADQLGRQAARRLHPSTPRPRQERLEPPAATKSATQTVSAATWVQPVSGDWGELVIGHLDPSYARHTPGPRSRAATTVREFMRRAPGTAKNAEKTVKVQSHYRKGTGPGDPTPTMTRVSGRRRLWR